VWDLSHAKMALAAKLVIDIAKLTKTVAKRSIVVAMYASTIQPVEKIRIASSHRISGMILFV